METENESENIEEEQEFLVYVDFERNLLPNDLDDPDMDIHIIGIDSEHPVIEINGKIFEGTFDFSVGTNIFFEKDENVPPLDPLYDLCPEEMYKLYTRTNKILKMRRMLVQNNQANEKESKEETFEELKERLRTNMSYKDALNLLLPPGCNPPRQVAEELEGSEEIATKQTFQNRMEIDNESEMDESDPDYLPEKDV